MKLGIREYAFLAVLVAVPVRVGEGHALDPARVHPARRLKARGWEDERLGGAMGRWVG